MYYLNTAAIFFLGHPYIESTTVLSDETYTVTLSTKHQWNIPSGSRESLTAFFQSSKAQLGVSSRREGPEASMALSAITAAIVVKQVYLCSSSTRGGRKCVGRSHFPSLIRPGRQQKERALIKIPPFSRARHAPFIPRLLV